MLEMEKISEMDAEDEKLYNEIQKFNLVIKYIYNLINY